MLELLIIALACLLAATGLLLVQRRSRQPNVRRTLEALPVGLCSVGGDGEIRLWNREMERISGLPGSSAVGLHFRALRDPWPAALAEALDDGADGVIKRPLPETDGAVRWVILHSNPPSDGERTVLVDDISDYQRLQDEVLHRERLASIGRLAAGVAHEIGNPVTGIACVAQNLVDADGSEETQRSAEEILKQTERISRIVDSLVQFSHSGGNSQAVNCVPCNVADCVDEAIHLLSLDPSADRDCFLNRCNREYLVLADNQLLLQVFLNLLDNARSAAPPGGTIEIDAAQDDEQVVIDIENGGDPIAADVLARVFEPFYTTKDVGDGTGLGLSLVRGMLEDMDGEIELLSPRPGASDGVRAQLRLPRAEYDAHTLG